MGLSLKLLGGFSVRDETGKPLSLPTRKTRALLAYLAVNVDKPQQRDRLMALLWSDRGEQQARHSLNQALMSIRRLGNAAGLTLLDGERVTLLGDAIAIDVADFRERLANDPASAAALYEGPFLDGLTIPDPGFEEWLTVIRSNLHDSACNAISRVADRAIENEDTAKGIDTLRRLIALEPLREDAHRRLMNSLYLNGDRAGALRQYQACAEALRNDLQVEPDAATKELFEEIRNRDPFSTAPQVPPSDLAPTKTSLSLPDKASIAVLPFTNLTADPEQNYFGDGIAEEIITALSRFHSLFVIARGSSFSFKDQSLDPREIAGKLGVRYVLEGSVRKHASRIRVAAQLIDAEYGRHLWSERYDREAEDIFALQDEITLNIVGIIEPTIGLHERERARHSAQNSLDAWVLYQQGMDNYYLATSDSLQKALSLFEDAVRVAPYFATAHAMCADTLFRLALHSMPEKRAELLASGFEAAQTAVRHDPIDANCHFALGRIKLLQLQFDEALAAIDKALELNPNFAMAHFARGYALARDYPEEAIKCFDRARCLSPNDPMYAGFMNMRARACFNLGRFEEAVATARIATQCSNPRFWGSAILAASLQQLGQSDEARTALREALRLFPSFSAGFMKNALQHCDLPLISGPVAVREPGRFQGIAI